MNKRCPACGYEFGKRYNPSKQALALLSLRGNICKKKLNKVSNVIMSSIESDNDRYRYFLFLKAISGIDDEYIIKSINKYLYKKYYTKGKGFVYLREIIKNEKANRKKLLALEYKNIGRPPSIIKIKENESDKSD